MNLTRVLAELQEELSVLNAAIRSLERLQNVRPRRGRLPKSVVNAALPQASPARGGRATARVKKGG